MTDPKKVFCSYRSIDRAEVHAFVDKLRERGLDAWFDQYEIDAGDDIVRRMGDGLDGCTAALIFFSSRDASGVWFNNEVSTLVCRRNNEGIRVIPVMIDAGASVPGLLKPLARRGLDDFQQIIDALLGVTRKRPLGNAATAARTGNFTLKLVGPTSGRINLVATHNGESVARVDGVSLSPRLQRTYAEFLRGEMKLTVRGPEEAAHATLSQALVELGDELGAVLFQGAIGTALRSRLNDVSASDSLDLCFEASDPRLLALPFEAARLDGQPPALRSGVRVLRRVEGAKPARIVAVAAPLKILVAIGAPDEGKTKNSVLDLENELQGVLDALSERMQQRNADVRILEVGSPDQIEQALTRDEYHVLHLSGHGGKGAIELEDEDGAPVRVTARQLVESFVHAERTVPLVFLSSCYGGSSSDDTTSLAVELIREGVPYVLAMQTRVTDGYASALSREFYAALSGPERPHASQALAVARQKLENERLAAVRRGESVSQTQPEYATASLFVNARESTLVDYALDLAPLKAPPVRTVPGPVPVLSVGDLIGRRTELRGVLRVLRDHAESVKAIGKRAGVVLTGIGGVGKSSVAGRAMTRLKEDGWTVAATSGRFSVAEIATALGAALRDHPKPELAKLADTLAHPQLNDRQRLGAILGLLQTERVLLVLDNFEDNLATGGSSYLDEATLIWLRLLCERAQTGKLLVTSRYPLPQLDLELHHQPLGPLTSAQVRKLMWRHPALRELSSDDLREVLRHIGGHPRMLEFLDGILRKGTTRLTAVARRMRDAAKGTGIKLGAGVDSLEEALRATALLGARDILLDELVDLARANSDEEALLQCAVSSLPMTTADLAHALADGAPSSAQVAAARVSLERLAELSLITALGPDAFWVHRWTAEALVSRSSSTDSRARFARAARARLARSGPAGIAFEDIAEATHNFLDAELWDEASTLALQITEFLQHRNQSIGAAGFASQILRRLPTDHENWGALADMEAQSHLALGFTQVALARYQSLLHAYEERLRREPDRADHQRNLSASYERLGDLLAALGKGEQARASYERSLKLREQLSQAEPDRADYQRDLSVSCNKLGDLMRALGKGEQARAFYERSLKLRERLAQAEPDRAVYQRDLSVSWNKLGDLMRALGQGEQARALYERSLKSIERLAQAEPELADYQRELLVSHSTLGELLLALGKGKQAHAYFEKALSIAERLAQAEPERADYQRDLSVSCGRLGNLLFTLGHGGQARELFEKGLAITERLAQAEPERADYQRDLSVSYNMLGDLMIDLGEGEQARGFYEKELAIAERLAQAESDRADYQRDLGLSLMNVATMNSSVADAARALALLHALLDSGRLAPADAGMIADAEALRDQLAKGAPPAT
jgi:tetratricopeptide (TPR) repeat protein